MTPLEELTHLAVEKSRRIFVAQNSINLSVSEGRNCVYVLQLPTDSPGSVGGRVGGIGERRLAKISCFKQENGVWKKLYDSDNQEKLEKFDLPYHAAGLAIVLPDQTERVVAGVVDEEFVQRYNEII